MRRLLVAAILTLAAGPVAAQPTDPTIPQPCVVRVLSAYAECSKLAARRFEPSGESAGDLADAGVAACAPAARTFLASTCGIDRLEIEEYMGRLTPRVRGLALVEIAELRASRPRR